MEKENNKSVSIFGCGEAGKYSYDFCKCLGIEVQCFVDNDREKWGKTFQDLKIISPFELYKIKDQVSYVIIASLAEKDIAEQLKGMMIDNVILARKQSLSEADLAKLELLKKNRKYKDKHNGERCFVIGNGPSLKKQDLSLLKNEITFATNFFPLIENFDELGINYYCVADHRFWKPNFDPKIYEILDKNKEVIKFFDYKTHDFMLKQNLFKGHEIAYVWTSYFMKVFEGVFSFDLEGALGAGGSVVIDVCLPLAYYMGFKEIYLIGCDQEYKFKNDGTTSSHFYNYKQGEERAYLNMKNYERWQNDVIGSYEVMKKAFENSGKMIYNATSGGQLEVFPRVKYESLFN